MASVTIRFKTPTEADVVALHIYESAAIAGPFVDIERTVNVGVYPTYISTYTTAAATSRDDYFAIAWETSDGVVGDMSVPVKGGQETLLGMLIDRVLQRDKSLDPDVVAQEAEAVIEKYVGIDPYLADFASLPSSPYSTLNGLVYLVMARSMLDKLIKTSSVTKATIGLVSMQSGDTTASIKNIQSIIEMANDLLGQSLSLVMVLEDVQIGASVSNTWRDQSRLVLETEIL